MPGHKTDMGNTEYQELEHTLTELEQRIMARIGKWALTIIGSCVAIAIVASSNWFEVLGRVDRLETWKTERTQPIEAYYETQQLNAERFAKIEAKLEEIFRLLKAESR